MEVEVTGLLCNVAAEIGVEKVLHSPSLMTELRNFPSLLPTEGRLLSMDFRENI